MKVFPLLAVLFLAVFSMGCPSPTSVCSTATCANGCCDATGKCQAGNTSDACGSAAAMCTQCSFGSQCSFGVCSQVNRSGGGTAVSGGGSAGGGSDTGGGVGVTGGGSAGGGNVGGGSTGGGNAGGGSTGGGNAGGGVGVTGGGSSGGGSGVDCRQTNNCNSMESCDFQTGQCICLPAYRSCNGTCALCPTTDVATTTCSGSQCVAATCTGTLRACNGACKVCPTSNVASTTCSTSNTCVAATCSSGYRACDGVCAQCPAGATATACGPSGSAQCVATACGANSNLCSGSCAADTDATRCGASCTACAAESGTNVTGSWTPVCRAGVCGQGCPAGQTLCKGVCASGSCTWSTTTVQQGVSAIGTAAAKGAASVGYFTYLVTGNNNAQLVAQFSRSGSATFPGGQNTPQYGGLGYTTNRYGLVGVSSPPGHSFTTGSPQTYGFDLLSYDGQSYLSAFSAESGTSSTVRSVDYSDLGIAMLRYSSTATNHYIFTGGDGNSTQYTSATGPDNDAVWDISTPTSIRMAWFSSGTLKIATKGTSAWTVASATSSPSTPGMLRSAPDGKLVNLRTTANGLMVEFEKQAWAGIEIPLPSGAVTRAKFDPNGVFHVVTSHSTTGTMLYTLQGNRFTSEQVSTQAVGKVDFVVLTDGQAVVTTMGPDAVLYR